MRRKNFKYGDRTNFIVYDSIESYRTQNPDANPIYSAFVESAIQRNGYAVKIEGVTSESGKDLSDLARDFLDSLHILRPNYVFGPSFKLGNTQEDKERGRAVSKFIRQSEAAHEATKNSKLVFRVG